MPTQLNSRRWTVKDWVYLGVRIYFALAAATSVTFALWAIGQAITG